MNVILEGKNVSRFFGGLAAVLEVDFQVNQGEIFGLIGPNGAGKTTLFRVISGVYPPTTGRIFFKGHDITGHTPHTPCHQGICSTHQVVKPFPDMTVLENVMVGAYYGAGIGDRKTAETRAMDALEFTGLAARANQIAKTLTLPDRNRLEIARALATKPEVVLLDEVIAGLNPTETDRTMGLVRQMRDRGITIFMVEHVMRAVMGLCDRVMVLNYGKKIAEGTPQEIARNSEVIEAYLGKGFQALSRKGSG